MCGVATKLSNVTFLKMQLFYQTSIDSLSFILIQSHQFRLVIVFLRVCVHHFINEDITMLAIGQSIAIGIFIDGKL